ncbi:GEVED domain-containing protein [Flavobacterium gelatinilyticum]|uniref:GEVED domain-containing protein n=1 Tax=Flavobacterium gelatinilyticum TaxID=3003260 RepID=UPI00247FE1AC|nr:GEVED domain-containing protein [Flavobacterium gelatinilyticum]
MKKNYFKLSFFTFLITLFPLAVLAQVWENVGGLSGISAGGSSFNKLVKDEAGNLYASYYDVSVTKGSVQKFDGTSWSYLGGSPGITAGTATFGALAAKDAQNVYFSNPAGYPDIGMNVRKFDGTSWASLPNPEGGSVTQQALAIDPSGILYAAYGTANGTVKRFVNGAWEQVGTTGFANAAPAFINLKIGTNGKVYVSFNNNGYVHVYENDLTAPSNQAWNPVGNVINIAAASNSENYNSSLAIDAANNLYLAFVSGSSGGQKLNVKKYNGTAWENLGAENFSQGRVQHVSIAVTASGVPYVVCSNWEDTDFLKNYAYGFDNESWIKIGGFASTGQATYNSLLVDNNEDLILAFSDSGVEKTVVKKFDIESPITKYCEVKFPQNTEPITQVTFAGISNSSPEAIGTTTPAYEDFTTVFGNVDLDGTYPISVSGNNDTNTINNFSNHITVYFDWNHNGSLLDEGEAYYLGYIQGNASIETLTGNIKVPADARTGNTRMRIVKKYYSTTNQSIAEACNTTGYGQAEDYTVVVHKKQVAAAEVTVSVLNDGAPAINTLGGTLQLVKKVLPAEAGQNVIWSISSGADFAAISSSGLVTAKGDGVVTVKVTSVENAAVFTEINITISNQTPPAVCNFETLQLTGFNADVVAEGTEGNADTKTSAIIDAANVFYAKNFVPKNPHSSAASAAAFGGGLPENGTIASTSVQGLNFQFADFTTNNALVLRNTLTNTGTLTLTAPKKAQKVYIASVAAEGNNTVTITVNFDDQTTQTFTLEATDWWQAGSLSNKVITGIGRVSRGASWAPLNQFDGLSQTGIYQNEFAIESANQQKAVTSITFSQTPPSGSASTTAILAVSICGSSNTTTEGPVAITSGFNHDIIANGIGNASESTTVGFDEANTRALVSLDFKASAGNTAPSFGLPVDGKIISDATPGVTFQLADYSGPNVLFLTPSHVDNGSTHSGTLEFSASNSEKLYVLTAASGGGSNNLKFNAVVNFADGTSQTISNVTVSDWYDGTNFAIQGIGRVNTANNNLEGNSTNPRLYEVGLVIEKANQNKTITGVNFSFDGDAGAEYASQIRMSVLAITTKKAAPTANVLTLAALNNVPAVITVKDGSLELTASLNGQAITASDVNWTITEGSSFASLDADGKVTALANGTVKVKAVLKTDAAVFAEISVSISNQVVPMACTFTALEVTGFNADVVAEGTEGDADAKTTAVIDAANVFYTKDFVPKNPHSSSVSAAAFGGGLPENGTVASASVAGLEFKLADFTANNALVLRNNLTNAGTLTLTTPKKAQKVYIASVAAEGNNRITVTVNFDDQTTQTFPLEATDWWQTGSLSNKVITGIGRVSRGASWAPLNQFDGLSQTGIYQNELVLEDANFKKSITSITFSQTPPSGSATTTAVLAVSICGSSDTTTDGPVAITSGFNHDIIANGIGNASESTTVGFDEANTRALVSLDFKASVGNAAPSFGLPADGKIISAATPGVTFQLADYSGANALFLTPAHVGNGAASTGTLEFSASNSEKLYLLAAASGGGSNNLKFNAVVHFTDGTSQTISNVTVSDWYDGTNAAIQGIGRVNIANNNLEGNSTNPRLYEVLLSIESGNINKTIKSADFDFAGDAGAEYASQIRMSILAITTKQPITDVLMLAAANGAPAAITLKNGILDVQVSLNNNVIAGSEVNWTITEGSSLATIDSNGKVTAVDNGTVKVKASLKSNLAVTAEIEITISGQPAKYCESYFVNGCENLSIISVATTGAAVNLNNTSTCSGQGYSDFTDKVLTANINTDITFNVHFTGSLVGFTFLSVWIDWNQDMIFDDNEMVYVSQSEEVGGALQFTTSVPPNALLGSTRMRFKAVSGWVGSGACGFNSQGETEDYTINVEAKLGTGDFDKASYSIYPNPTSDYASIEASEVVKEVTVFNITGQQISNGKSSVIDLSNVPQGVYLVRILFENGKTVVQKMIRK